MNFVHISQKSTKNQKNKALFIQIISKKRGKRERKVMWNLRMQRKQDKTAYITFPQVRAYILQGVLFLNSNIFKQTSFFVINIYLPSCLPKAFSSFHPLLPLPRRQEQKTQPKLQGWKVNIFKKTAFGICVSIF